MMILNLGLRFWGFEDLGGAEVGVVKCIPLTHQQGKLRVSVQGSGSRT